MSKIAQIRELEKALQRQREITKLAEREERRALKKLAAMRYERVYGQPPPSKKVKKVKTIKLVGSPLLHRFRSADLQGVTLFDPRDLDIAIVCFQDVEGRGLVAVYDYSKVLSVYVDLFTLDYGDRDAAWQSAIDWVEHNIIGAVSLMGERAPIIVDRDLKRGHPIVIDGVKYARIV